MKIENNHLNPLQTNKPEAAQPLEKPQKPVEHAKVAPQKDTLEVSEKARLLSKARAAVDGVEEARSQKVENLKNLVNSGEYKVQHEEVAKRLAKHIDIKR